MMTQRHVTQQIEQLQAQIDKLNNQYRIVPGCTVKCIKQGVHDCVTVGKLYKVAQGTRGKDRCLIVKDDQGDSNDLPIDYFVRATEQEIEAVKPIKFGTHVRTHRGTYGRVACDGPDNDGDYLIAARLASGRYIEKVFVHSEYYAREDFTVLSRAPRNKTTK